MSLTTYKINSRNYTVFGSLAEELTFDKQKNYLFDLSYLSVLDVQGIRGSEFLQGQLTCDLRKVNNKQMQQGALCNLKGRILALQDIIEWQTLHLILPQDLLADVQLSLNKTALFSQVKLQPANYKIFGFKLNNPEDFIPFNALLPHEKYGITHTENYCCYHLGDNMYVFITASVTMPKDHIIWRGSLAWHALQLQRHQIEIYPESRGLFLPHRLGLQNTGYLSFDKGCYKGQEIIARTHYRAKLKHELKLFNIVTQENLQSGKRLFDAENQTEIGELIDFCPIGENQYLIAASVLFEHASIILLEDSKQTILLDSPHAF